jgi:simple sugar transport system ATP-binding protein
MVRESAADAPAGTLSGGNQQRILLARELVGAPRIIVAAQPTRGVDVAGASFVHDTLREYRDRGAGILLVSTELDELLALSDRILVLFRGQIMGEMRGDDADPLALGAMMMGRKGGAVGL